jgi:hypothetical protein
MILVVGLALLKTTPQNKKTIWVTQDADIALKMEANRVLEDTRVEQRLNTLVFLFHN